MEVKNIVYPTADEYYNNLILEFVTENASVKFGSVFLKKGARIPEQGFSKHPEYEISIVQKGEIEMLAEDGSTIGNLKKGHVVYLKALEAQAGNVLEDTEIIYFLIKD